MGAFGGPDIITDGLQLAIDAGSIRSYPGSGTTVTDLVGTNNGTLTNGVGYSSANGGSFIFDGVDDYIDYTNSINPVSSFSCSAWINLSNINPSGSDFPVLTKWSSSPTSSRNFIFGYRSSGSQKGISFYLYNSSYTQQDNYRTDWNPSANVWYYITAVFSAGSFVKIYVNGVADFTRTSGVYSSLNANSTESIKSGLTTGLSPFPGKIAISRIYNQALTDVEVLQNYNAQKNRFI